MNIRLTFLLLAILLLFGGTILVVQMTREAPPEPDQPWLFKVDDNTITHIEVAYQGDTAVYDKKAGGTKWFILEEGREIPVFQEKWSGTPLLLSGPRVNRKLSDEIGNAAAYGLDPPETVVRVTERTGRTYEFHMGIVTPDGENQYARLVGSEELFTVPQIWAMVINRLVFQPPYPRLYDMDGENDRRDKTVYFEVTQGSDQSIFQYRGRELDSWLRLEPLDARGPVTSVCAPGFALSEETEYAEWALAPADWGNADLLLDNPQADNVVADEFDDPENYGLEPPRAVVCVGTLSDQLHEFYLGNPTPDGQSRYATTVGNPALFTVPAAWADSLERLATDPPAGELVPAAEAAAGS